MPASLSRSFQTPATPGVIPLSWQAFQGRCVTVLGVFHMSAESLRCKHLHKVDLNMDGVLSRPIARSVSRTCPVWSVSLPPSRSVYLESNVIPNQSTHITGSPRSQGIPVGSTFYSFWDKMPRRVREHCSPGKTPPLKFHSTSFALQIQTDCPAIWSVDSHCPTNLTYWQMTQLCFLSDSSPHPFFKLYEYKGQFELPEDKPSSALDGESLRQRTRLSGYWPDGCPHPPPHKPLPLWTLMGYQMKSRSEPVIGFTLITSELPSKTLLAWMPWTGNWWGPRASSSWGHWLDPGDTARWHPWPLTPQKTLGHLFSIHSFLFHPTWGEAGLVTADTLLHSIPRGKSHLRHSP